MPFLPPPCVAAPFPLSTAHDQVCHFADPPPPAAGPVRLGLSWPRRLHPHPAVTLQLICLTSYHVSIPTTSSGRIRDSSWVAADSSWVAVPRVVFKESST